MKILSLVFIISLLLSSIRLVPMIFSENNNKNDQEQAGDDEHGARTDGGGRGSSGFLLKDLVQSSSGGCPYKAASSLLKAGRDSKEMLREVRQSLLDFAQQTLVEGDPEVAARSVLETMDSLRNDVLSNTSEAAVETASQVQHEVKLHLEGKKASTLLFVKLLRHVRFLAGLVGLLGYVTAYGMSVWVVFISNYVLARALPKWQLPGVERAVSGVYCRAMAWCVVGAVAGHFLGPWSSGVFEGFNLLASLSMVMVNMLYLEPRATKMVLEKMELEREEEELEGLPCGGGGRVEASSQSPEQPPLIDGPPVSAVSTKTDVTSSEKMLPLADGWLDQHNPTLSRKKAREAIMRTGRATGLSARVRTINSWCWWLNVMVLTSLTWHLGYLLNHLQNYEVLRFSLETPL